MSLLSSKTQILRESFFGGSKELKQAEKLIEQLIVIAEKNRSNGKFKLSDCETNKKLEKTLAKQFGVQSVNIHWMMSPIATLYTRPYMTSFSGVSEYYNRENYKKTKVFKNSEKQIYISSNDGFLLDVGLTPEEILATLLHEIGHNFDTTALRIIAGIPVFWYSIAISNYGAAIDKTKDEILRKIDKISQPFTQMMFLITKEMSFLAPIERIGKLIRNGFSFTGPSWMKPENYKKAALANFGMSFAGYGAERFSDSFATSYGYGVPLNSALGKLDRFYNEGTFYGAVINNIPVVNCMYSFAFIFNNICTSIMGVHPDNGIRMKSTINKLKRDLNDPSVDKQLKKVIIKDLETLEQMYDDYLNVKDMPEYKTCVLVAYRKMCNKLFGGKFNVHELLNLLYEYEEV